MEKEPYLQIVEAGDFAPGQEFSIHTATSSRDLFDVYRLTSSYYKSKGVANSHPDGLWVSYPEFDHCPQTTILVARQGQELIASISLTRDGLKGLTVDRQFGRTCALIRAEGRRIGEIWRLVLKPGLEKAKLNAALIAAATLRLMSDGAQTFLLSLHPDHVDPAKDLLNVVTLGGQFSPGAGVISLPTVLMRCDVENLPDSWRGAKTHSSKAS